MSLRSTRVCLLAVLVAATPLAACGDDPAKPPTIVSIEPDPICSDGTGFTITGTGFDKKAHVSVNGTDGTVMVQDPMHIIVTVPAGALTSGDNTVTVTNPDNQAAMGTVSGEAKPLMFFVDPGVLSSDMTARVTVYMSGLTTSVQGISVALHSDAAPNPNASTALTDIAAVTGHPNQAQATVTGGTLTAGAYDVTVTDGVCSATLPSGLTVVSAPDITITKVEPPFGAPDADTAITLTTSGYALTETPRVYLSANGKATALRAVSWQSATSVSAVVPAGALPAGDYDVIVIDPIDASGGHVGVLTKGFHLITAPPQITTVTPHTIIATQNENLAIAGSGFATGSTPTAWLSSCTAPAGVTPPTTPFALPAISGATATALTVSIPAGTMPAGTVCVLRLMNGTPTDAANPCPAGGTCVPYADYSAIASVNGSGNLGTFAQSTASSTDIRQLPSPRTRLGAVVGHVTEQARFLYVVGGDDGTEANAHNDVVSSQLDELGNMGAWTTQRNTLTAHRTGQATLRVGSFIYAIGGYNGTAVVGSVERARILDPLDVPSVPDLDLTPAAQGLAAGTWVYRITGVRAANYASDPGGETLPSDPINVTLPDVTNLTGTPLIKVTLTWPTMQDVVSYNIYRTSTSGKGAQDVQLIANVPQPTAGSTVTVDDTGLATSAQTPLPLGSLGRWHAVSSLTAPRYGAAATVAVGARTATTQTYYLYVGGGASDTALTSTGLLDTYEVATITETLSDGAQSLGTFAIGQSGGNAASIGTARAFLSAYAVDNTIKSQVPAGTTHVYFGSGMRKTTSLGLVSAMVTGQVTSTATTADLANVTTVNSAPVGGAGAATISGYLFTIGGWNSGLSIQNTNAATLCPTTGCSASPPALTTWNNGGGGTPNVARVLLGTVVEPPFIYILGGSTVTGATNATASTERTVW